MNESKITRYTTLKTEVKNYIERLENIGIDMGEIKSNMAKLEQEMKKAQESKLENTDIYEEQSAQLEKMKEDIIHKWGPILKCLRWLQP